MTTVLVVEDEALIARELKRTLVRLGYSVPRTASSAAEALRAMAAQTPDLVLMDVNLAGELDGVATAATIRRRWDVPVVYLTAHADDATLTRAKDTGPHGYLVKPFNERDLRITIEVALRKHEMEVELARRERWFSTTLQSIGDAVIAADGEDRITFMNAVAERLTGWSLAEAKGQRLVDVFRLVDQDGAQLESPVVRALAHGFAIELPANTRMVSRDDQRHDVDDSSAPIIDARGEVLGGVVVFRDVTARKQLERRVAQSERLAAIGTMAAGMAHELNNPLAAVVANVEVAIEGLEQARATLSAGGEIGGLEAKLRSLSEALGDARMGAQRATMVTRELARFALPGTQKREVLDLPDVLDAAIAAVDAGATAGLTIERRYGTTAYVEANTARLVQAFGNLLANALGAVAKDSARKRAVLVVTRTDDEGRPVVEIRDTGPGIAPADLERVFDPFFGAHRSGIPSGTGLAFAHGIVTAIGGDIRAESELGRGTVFRVTLPPADGAKRRRVEEPTPPSASAETPPRRRVLAIDDDEQIGRLFRRVLGTEHDVLVEQDPHKALARLQSDEHFDVVFCDMMMPRLTGAELYEALRASHPGREAAFVFVTGGVVGDAARGFLSSVGRPVLQKPFSPAALRQFVRAYFEGRAA